MGAKSYRFFHDSKEVPDIGFTGKNDAQMSSCQAIIVGAELYQMPPAPFVIWFEIGPSTTTRSVASNIPA